MKIIALSIANFLGLKHVEIQAERPITLIAGANESGKTSLLEGINLAFLGAAPRLGLKKDAAELVHEGAKAGHVRVEWSDSSGAKHENAITLPRLDFTGPDAPDGLSCVLGAQHFSSLSPDDRRKFLFRLMNVKITPEEIAKRLTARGCDAKKVQEMSPMFRVTE